MTNDPEQAKRPVSAALTVPIGAWVSSLAFDVASLIVDDPGFLARGSVWLIALGVVGARTDWSRSRPWSWCCSRPWASAAADPVPRYPQPLRSG
ncbi:hypothetical protein [Amycolatopsis japonica]|uniref:hypothetical protein n=1 Tax=Amycolatopsis japonica TaxID=208439 RepID=UPI0033D492F4